MEIYNTNNEIITNYDLTKGYLVDDTLYVPEQPEIKEKSHFELVKEYDNGGKDYIKVIDVQKQDYRPAHTKNIKVYKPYSHYELMQIKYKNEYEELKNWFDIDYARLEQKYRRLYTLKLYCDDGSYPYDKLIDLYNEAEYKRARIQELERLISNEVV